MAREYSFSITAIKARESFPRLVLYTIIKNARYEIDEIDQGCYTVTKCSIDYKEKTAIGMANSLPLAIAMLFEDIEQQGEDLEASKYLEVSDYIIPKKDSSVDLGLDNFKKARLNRTADHTIPKNDSSVDFEVSRVVPFRGSCEKCNQSVRRGQKKCINCGNELTNT